MRRLFIVCIFLYSVFSYSQRSSSIDLPEIIPPSPTVASLMKVEEIPVNYYTGQPNISIPLFQKAVSQNLNYELDISYNTTNLKTTERSSWVGVSWTLNGEAVISRTVRGIPDEFNLNTHSNSNRSLKQVGVLHNGYFDFDWQTPQNSLGSKTFLWNTMGWGSGTYAQEGALDKDIDLYQVNIFGKTARFIVTRITPHNELFIEFLENNFNLKIEIEAYDHTSFEITSFLVSDEHGNKFRLDQAEYTTSRNLTYPVYYQNGTESNPNEITNTFQSAWKVSQVFNSNDQNLIKFNYNDVIEKYSTGIRKTRNNINAITLEEGNTFLYNPNESETFTKEHHLGDYNYYHKYIFNGPPNNQFNAHHSPYNNGIALPQESNTIVLLQHKQKK